MERVEYQPLLIQDILNYHRSEELNLAPWYQRRSIWTTPQKAYLINTLHEQKPVPAIYIRYSLDLEAAKTIREVVDGQQRTRAIIDYCDNVFPARLPFMEAKKTFSELNREQRTTFLLTAIPVGYLLGATDEDVIDIFGRINSVSKTLNSQERRNAAYSGEFKQFCLSQASSRISLWRHYQLFSATEIARMGEVQFISDVILNMLRGLSDFSQPSLDRLYKEYEDDFPNHASIIRRLDRVFDFIVQLDVSAIRDTIFARQPIFFSLLLVLDSLKGLPKRKIENLLHEMDHRFYEHQTPADVDFAAASMATTQRIRQRTIRDKYIRGFLA
ncbi:MAG: DUF262 domain-containing protein [Chloroflexi bacterium]|nr:DUF262 domain-containing protein [Chloroflexota bacterium]